MRFIWAIIFLVLGFIIILELRYDFFVSSPVVAKFDRLTGEAWIVNAGVWRKIKHTEEAKETKGFNIKPARRQTGRK